MFSEIAILVLGLLLIVFGADFIVDGASSIARKIGVSEFVIGLTIVGFGTSCPELVVSLTGSIQGSADISIGNVLGSNVFNTLLILGLSAFILPIPITSENRKRDIPITLAITVLLVALGKSKSYLGLGEDRLDRICGIVFLLIFCAYMFYCFKKDSPEQAAEQEEEQSGWKKFVSNTWGAIFLVLAGLAGLIFGGRMFVDSATAIARDLGVGEKFIAITILAAGTSLPELATSVVAAAKGKGQLALGNILGSNIFNILLILGLSAVVSPLSFGHITNIDIVAFLLSALVVMICAFTGRKDKIDRWEGLLMMLCFFAYIVYLFINL